MECPFCSWFHSKEFHWIYSEWSKDLYFKALCSGVHWRRSAFFPLDHVELTAECNIPEKDRVQIGWIMYNIKQTMERRTRFLFKSFACNNYKTRWATKRIKCLATTALSLSSPPTAISSKLNMYVLLFVCICCTCNILRPSVMKGPRSRAQGNLCCATICLL